MEEIPVGDRKSGPHCHLDPGGDPPLRIPCIIPGAKRSPTPLTIWRDAIHFVATHNSARDRGGGIALTYTGRRRGGAPRLPGLLLSPPQYPVGGVRVQDGALRYGI
ncbi:uncharacterized protein LOC110435063 [Sorghum bicolor]|uniref:uncharacterized protein LOC110435063 n=1 Tax=Sorghum bicolor TaxID=4558 RepID=UPI000B425988|nr:uncharacterized protein LOC110435063 [Sorghum bicolor]|eukprot:XP_021316058.1 uncharacterized protein LOC110435063 [Sorghum bicolor]